MNRPSVLRSFDTPSTQSIPSASNQLPLPQHSQLPHPTTSNQQNNNTHPHFPYYPSSVHLPAVSTYIGHYHYYNFNGNCTVQQASIDGQPNTIQMANSSSLPQQLQPQPPPPPPQTQQQQHRQNPEPHHSPINVPPIPPPLQQPIRATPPNPSSYTHYQTQQTPTNTSNPQDKRDNIPTSSSYTSLPINRLAPLSGNVPSTLPLQSASANRSTTFLPQPRLTSSQTSLPSPTPIQGQSTTMLPRMRTGIDNDAPTLAPLQTTNIGPQISPLHRDNEKLDNTRPMKRSRISNVPNTSIALPDMSNPSHGTTNVLTNPPPQMPPSTFGGVGAASESNCGSGSDDRGGLGRRNPTAVTYGTDRAIHATNSSSPSRGEYSIAQGRNEPFERSSSGMGNIIRGNRNIEESQSNDWEVVVEMYTTGKGTEDGVALKSITKGDGRRVADRKLLEKRRTIGKTYERLGMKRFEAAIGYKWENGIRRKQKMYHVINRCRVVNAMHKSGEQIPEDCTDLTNLIDQRIAAKEAIKEAGKFGSTVRRPDLIGGSGLSHSGMNEMNTSNRLSTIPQGSGNNVVGSMAMNQIPRYGRDNTGGMNMGNRREEESIRYVADRPNETRNLRTEETNNRSGGGLGNVQTGYSGDKATGNKYTGGRVFEREQYR